MTQPEQVVHCGCGCGFRLAPGMYGFLIAGNWYAQRCIGILRPVTLARADSNSEAGK